MKLEVIQKLSALVTAAFGLVAALAWNGTIQAIFKEFYGETSTIWAMLTYAIIVTIIAVWVTISVGKAETRIKEKAEKETQEAEMPKK
jgi:uncharacterized membrane protein YidH (DUF202 family)